MTDRTFYVYTWTRPDTGEVFYVGKGHGGRDRRRKANPHFQNIVAKLMRNDLEPIVFRVADGLTEGEAFERERIEITKFGRREFGGTLCNLTDGGDGASGYIPKDSTRAKLSIVGKERQADPNERARHSAVLRRYYENPEARTKLSAGQRRYWDVDGGDTARERQSIAMLRRFEDDFQRERQGAANRMAPPRSGNKSGFKGVGFFARTEKWVAKIKVGGTSKNLGYFADIEDAARAYDAAAVEAWGQGNCYLNFPTLAAAA